MQLNWQAFLSIAITINQWIYNAWAASKIPTYILSHNVMLFPISSTGIYSVNHPVDENWIRPQGKNG